MTIKPINVENLSFMFEMKRRQIVRQGGPHLGVEFEDPCLG